MMFTLMLWPKMKLIQMLGKFSHQWDMKTPLDYNGKYPFVLFCNFHHSMIMKEFHIDSILCCFTNWHKILSKMKDMKHIRNFNNVACMEANENCSHTNCFLAPIIPHEHREGRLQKFVCGKPISSRCQMFSCTCIQIPNICIVVFICNNCHEKLNYFNWRCIGLGFEHPISMISCFILAFWNDVPLSSTIMTSHIKIVFGLGVWCEISSTLICIVVFTIFGWASTCFGKEPNRFWAFFFMSWWRP